MQLRGCNFSHQPREARHAPCGFVYLTLNRAVARLPFFEKDGNYEAFEGVLGDRYSPLTDAHALDALVRPLMLGLRRTFFSAFLRPDPPFQGHIRHPFNGHEQRRGAQIGLSQILCQRQGVELGQLVDQAWGRVSSLFG